MIRDTHSAAFANVTDDTAGVRKLLPSFARDEGTGFYPRPDHTDSVLLSEQPGRRMQPPGAGGRKEIKKREKLSQAVKKNSG